MFKAVLILYFVDYDNATIGGWALYFMSPTEDHFATGHGGGHGGIQCDGTAAVTWQHPRIPIAPQDTMSYFYGKPPRGLLLASTIDSPIQTSMFI
mgnify:CR=1 FL=1